MSDAGLAPDEARAVAWCAAADVAAGVTTDDAGAAMRGWLSAAYRAAADAGVDPRVDAIVRAQDRVGPSATALAYARERSRILRERGQILTERIAASRARGAEATEGHDDGGLPRGPRAADPRRG